MINNNFLLNFAAVSAISAGIYLFFGPNQTTILSNRKRKKVKINGLENIGTNCYINVIVQSLCSSQNFIDWLKESLIQQELSPNLLIDNQLSAIRFIHYLFSIIFRNNFIYKLLIDSNKKSTRICIDKTLTFQLLKLLLEVNGKDNLDNSLNANILLEILYDFNFDGANQQQDAHELFNILTNSLEFEILRTLNKTTNPINIIQLNNNNNNQIESIKLNKDLNLNLSIDGDFISKTIKNDKESNIFNISKELNYDYDMIKRSLNLKRNLPTKGLLAHQLHCLKCDHRFCLQFENFHSISLAIPKIFGRGQITLKDCLNKFVSREILDDVNCENCQILDNKDVENESLKNRTTKKSKFAKRLTFAKYPQLLVIHFQRLICTSNGRLIKREDRINFPEYLSMDEYYVIKQQLNNSLNNSNTINNTLNNIQNDDLNKTIDNSQSSIDQQSRKNLDYNEKLNLSLKEKNSKCLDSKEINLDNEIKKEENLINDIKIDKENNSNDNLNLSNNDKFNLEEDKKIKNSNNLELLLDNLNDTKCNDKSFNNLENNIVNNIDIDIDINVNGNINLKNNLDINIDLNLDNINEIIKLNEQSIDKENNILNNNDILSTSNSINENTKIQATKENLNIHNELSTIKSNSIKSTIESSVSSSISLSKNNHTKKYRYKLNACIVHQGKTTGHYVNYRRLANNSSSTNNDWYMCSDSIIRNSSLEECLSSNAYMLFYERIK